MVSTGANDLDPPSHGGRAVAAAIARHLLSLGEPLMAGWDGDEGTSVSATERLRATWAFGRRSTAAATREPTQAEKNDHAHEPPERAN
jgi:hypothetical protein